MATTERAQRYMGLIAATVFVLALAGFGVTLPGYLQASHPVALLGAQGVPHALWRACRPRPAGVCAWADS